MISDKIRPHHLERKALLYVRQSSAHQVLHNRESSALQYAMRDRLTALGWSEIEVIDDDLGRSAAGGVVRAGCQSAFKFDPVSASNFDPFERRGLAVALASSELAGVAETWRARAV